MSISEDLVEKRRKRGSSSESEVNQSCEKNVGFASLGRYEPKYTVTYLRKIRFHGNDIGMNRPCSNVFVCSICSSDDSYRSFLHHIETVESDAEKVEKLKVSHGDKFGSRLDVFAISIG